MTPIIIFLILLLVEIPLFYLIPINIIKISKDGEDSRFTKSIIRFCAAFITLLFLSFIANLLPFIFVLDFIVWFIILALFIFITWFLFIIKIINKKIILNWNNVKVDLIIWSLFLLILIIFNFQPVKNFNFDNRYYLDLVKSNSWFKHININTSFSWNNHDVSSYYLNESYYLIISVFKMASGSLIYSTLMMNSILIFTFSMILIYLIYIYGSSRWNWNILIFIFLAIVLTFMQNYFLKWSVRGTDLSFALGSLLLFFIIFIYKIDSKISNLYLLIFAIANSVVSSYVIFPELLFVILIVVYNKKINKELLSIIVFLFIFMTMIKFSTPNIIMTLVEISILTIMIILIYKTKIVDFLNKIINKVTNKQIIITILSISLMSLVFMVINNHWNIFNEKYPNYKIETLIDKLAWSNLSLYLNGKAGLFNIDLAILFVVLWTLVIYQTIKTKKFHYYTWLVFTVYNPCFWIIFYQILSDSSYRIYIISSNFFAIFIIMMSLKDVKFIQINKKINYGTLAFVPLVIFSASSISIYAKCASIKYNLGEGVLINNTNNSGKTYFNRDFNSLNNYVTNNDMILLADRELFLMQNFVNKGYFLNSYSAWWTNNNKFGSWKKAQPIIKDMKNNNLDLDEVNKLKSWNITLIMKFNSYSTQTNLLKPIMKIKDIYVEKLI